MKRAVIGCIVALGLVVGGGAGAAFAGETNGKGDPIPGAVSYTHLTLPTTERV